MSVRSEARSRYMKVTTDNNGGNYGNCGSGGGYRPLLHSTHWREVSEEALRSVETEMLQVLFYLHGQHHSMQRS